MRGIAIAASSTQQVAVAVNGRQDIEFILVDNNPDTIDRSTLLAPFTRWKYLKLGYNKGVSARNDGALASRGTFILFIDDDTFLTTVGALERYEKDFDDHPNVAVVTARIVDHNTGETLRSTFPHTDKSRVKDKPFKTFRFQGSGFAIRRSAFEKIGTLSVGILLWPRGTRVCVSDPERRIRDSLRARHLCRGTQSSRRTSTEESRGGNEPHEQDDHFVQVPCRRSISRSTSCCSRPICWS